MIALAAGASAPIPDSSCTALRTSPCFEPHHMHSYKMAVSRRTAARWRMCVLSALWAKIRTDEDIVHCMHCIECIYCVRSMAAEISKNVCTTWCSPSLQTCRISQPAVMAAGDMATWSAYSWNSGAAPTSSVAAMRGAAAGGGAMTSTSTPTRS